MPAREQGYWPAARKSSSALGCELPARRWGPTGKLFPNSGWHTPRRRACRLTTAGGSTSSCTERRQGVVRCAVTQPSSLPSPGQGNHTRAPLTPTARRSGSPSVANTRLTQNSARAGRSSPSCWARRSEAAGTPKPNASCATCSESGRNEPRRPCARRRARAGLVVGGAC